MKNAEKNKGFEIVRTSHHGANVAKGTRHPDDVGGWVPGTKNVSFQTERYSAFCHVFLFLSLSLSLSIAR